jgi:hypothetical protein
MTHTKDKTLLASLSFGDKDKKDNRHDLAGQYLLQPEVASRIIKLFSKKEWKFVGGNLELPLTKGHNQYKTFIGFLDGVLHFEEAGSSKLPDLWSVCFEVKINPETAGNVLRQLNLYREFGGSVDLLVTAYDVSPADRALFEENGIVCVRLGEAFDEFVRAQEAASKIRNDQIMVI